MTEDERKAMDAIIRIIERGNSAEVKKNTDGSIKVYEIRKHIIKAE